MLDTAIAFLWPDTAADLILQGDGVEARPPVGASGNVAEFKDGWATTMTLSDDEFHGMCRAYGCDDVATDPRFATLEARQRNRPALLDVMRTDIAPAAKRLTLAEAAARFAAEDVPFARARRLTELHEDPQIAHNQTSSAPSSIRSPARCDTHVRRHASVARPRHPAARRRSSDNTRARSSANSVSPTHIDDWLARGIVAAPPPDTGIHDRGITMNFGFTEEQELLRDQVRRFMQDACPMSEVRALMKSATGASPSLWRQAAELGWLGLIIPERFGGVGLKWVDLTVVLEETGRGLSPLPIMSQTLAATALLRCGSPTQQQRCCPHSRTAVGRDARAV